MRKLLKRWAIFFSLILGWFSVGQIHLSFAQVLPYQHLRSITYYDFPATSRQRLDHLRQDLPILKSVGFNAVWLVLPWVVYNPKPLADPPVYSHSEFEILKKTLQLLKENGMQAILGLNYLGPGWEPEGIEFCGGPNYDGWVQNPQMYQAFQQYVLEVLRQIQEYKDNVLILFFTENAEPCGNNWENAIANAQILRQTLGNIPYQLSRLDPDLRKKFRIGYHDYNLINLGWSIERGGGSPIADPNPFDFVSMVGYEFSFQEDFKEKSNQQIQAEIEKRAQRFKHLYPEVPLLIGEYGYRACENGEEQQARIVRVITEYAISNNYGFNLWQWKPGNTPAYICPDPDPGGFGMAITNRDGSQHLVVDQLRMVLRPRIKSAQVVTSFNPWAVSITGKNLTQNLVVKLLDQDKSQWDGFIGTTLAGDYSWLSFRLPANTPPSGCNYGQECQVSLQLIDIVSSLSSDELSLTLPATTPAPTSTCKENDLNCDGTVNLADLLHWRALWAAGRAGADVNGDGEGNIVDYLSILRGWLEA